MEPSWQELYSVAMLEAEAAKIDERIDAAELAMHERQRVLSKDPTRAPEEGQAIDDALRSLSVLRASRRAKA